MSFSCIKHGWQHLFSMCPACTEILVTSSTDVTYIKVLPHEQTALEGDLICPECDRDESICADCGKKGELVQEQYKGVLAESYLCECNRSWLTHRQSYELDMRLLKKTKEQLKIAKAAMENELEAMGEGNCCCGAEEPDGEGYKGVTCYLHEALDRIKELEK